MGNKSDSLQLILKPHIKYYSVELGIKLECLNSGIKMQVIPLNM
jgi:hypothetical protein